METINSHRLVPTLSVFILFLSAFIIFFSYVRSQNNSSSVPWQTYTTNTFGWTIKIPSEWYIYDKGYCADVNKGCENTDGSFNFSPLPLPEYIIEGTENPLKGLKIRFDPEKSDFSQVIKDYPNAQSLVIDNRNAIEIISDNRNNNEIPTAWRTKHAVVLIDYPYKDFKILQVFFDPGQYTIESEKIFDQILSTFRFIEKPTPSKTAVVSGCKVAGCSSELCVSAGSGDIASTCIWKEEYSCFKYSVCERQNDQKCAWTKTPEYQSCISAIRQ